MAIIKHIKRYVLKFRDGDYDTMLRSIPLVPATIALVLFAVDVDRYKKNSALHHANHTPSLILDVIALAFLSAATLCALMWCTILRHTQTQIRSWVVPAVDGLLSMALVSLADPALSIRSSKLNCLSGAGGMLILAGTPYHILWAFAAHRSYMRKKAKRLAKVIDAESHATTFSNEIT